MRRMTSGPLFLSMFLLACLASTPTLHAQPQPYYTLCRYQGQQDAHPIMYVTPIIHTSAAAGDINQDFNKYMTATYDLSKVQYGSGYCRQVSASADQQAYTMSQLESQWAASKTVVTHITWSDTPAEVAATNAKVASASASASAAAAAVAPPASANQYYVVCASGRDGPAVYYSDIFAAAPPAGTAPTQTKNGALLMFPTGYFQPMFLAFLQKKYALKSSGNYPVECGANFPPTTAGFQQAQTYKSSLQDIAKQNKSQIIETGWKGQ